MRSILIVAVLGICILAFVCGPRLGGEENWTVVMTIATLLAVVAALFLDDIKALLHRPEIELYVGSDLLDEGHDMDSDKIPARWIRGKITNTGDRGVENCRLKILKVEGPNIPYPRHVTKITNGFLQWEGGIRNTMRLNPSESWIFDIGTRRFDRIVTLFCGRISVPILRFTAIFDRPEPTH